jgi:protein SCO1/2
MEARLLRSADVAVVDTPAPVLIPARCRRRRGVRLATALVAALVAATMLAWWLVPAGKPGPPPPSLGSASDVALSASVLDAPLVDQHGRPVTLATFRGHILVLVPFLTSCQEQCPITTAALLSIHRALVGAGLGTKVVVAEASVDPGRDVPARMAAYADLTRTSWPLLTGSAETMAAIWRHLGVYAQPVPEGNPPGIDWQTGLPYTYDVDHSDGFILIGPDLHERFVTVAAADLQGRVLEPSLSRMLDRQGVSELRHPSSGSWTVPQALSAIGWLAGRAITASS